MTLLTKKLYCMCLTVNSSIILQALFNHLTENMEKQLKVF